MLDVLNGRKARLCVSKFEGCLLQSFIIEYFYLSEVLHGLVSLLFNNVCVFENFLKPLLHVFRNILCNVFTVFEIGYEPLLFGARGFVFC